MNRRFALIQALVSLIALAATVWWATKQEAPEFPSGAGAWAWLGAALGLYAVATCVRAERWHWILQVTGGRARQALKVVLLAPRCDTSRRVILGSVIAERILDLTALAAIFVVVVYGVL